MDLNELRLKGFLTNPNASISEELVEEFGELCKEALRKHFEEQKKDFTLRMSNIGRPSCQLQMAQKGATPLPTDYAHALRMMKGNILEALIIALLKASGVNVEEVQEKVTLTLPDGTEINGSYDVLIDGKIWDVKTASQWSYRNKFCKGYEELKRQDDFGYIAQGFGYAVAKGVPFGGWIVLDKSASEISFIPAVDTPEERERVLSEVRNTVRKVNKNGPFERCFSDEEELFYKKPTGRRKLGSTCSFCDYKYECWPGVKHAPNPDSKAKEPRWEYYTSGLEGTGVDEKDD